VAHVYDIHWKSSHNKNNSVVYKATVDIFLTPFKELNEEAKRNDSTEHRLMMVELKLWEKFQDLRFRACHRDGKHRKSFDVTREKELFYGFTRKNNKWYSTSCTLNSWIVSLTNKENPEVIRLAGKRGTDKFKDDLVNLLPMFLWEQMKVKLKLLAPYDGEPWSYNWASSRKDFESLSEISNEELTRMRSLINGSALGSSAYILNLNGLRLGNCGLSSVKAIATIFCEEMKSKNILFCETLQKLYLDGNNLRDCHVKILCPVLKKCTKLTFLGLSNNRISNDGLIDLCRHIPNGLIQLELDQNDFWRWDYRGLHELLRIIESTKDANKLEIVILWDRSYLSFPGFYETADPLIQVWRDLIRYSIKVKTISKQVYHKRIKMLKAIVKLENETDRIDIALELCDKSYVAELKARKKKILAELRDKDNACELDESDSSRQNEKCCMIS